MQARCAGDWPIRLTSSRKAIDIAPLDRVGWLADQPQFMFDWVASVGRWKRVTAGQFIYHAGDPSNGLWGLAEGALEISFPLVAEEPVTIHRAEVGFWIGDAAELSGRPRLISIAAASDARLLHVTSTEIRSFLDRHPEGWRPFYDLSRRNVAMALTLLSESLALTVKARICRRLLALAERDPAVQITQQELAKLVGVARVTARRSISELVAEGGLETGYRSLRIRNPEVLERYRDEQ